MQRFCNDISRRVVGSPAERVRAFESIARAGAAGVYGLAQRLGLSRGTAADAAAEVLRYCQGLPQYPDPPGGDDWVRDPCATAALGGDCDDLATLALALLVCCGVTARIVWLPLPEQREDHVTCQILLDGRWVWAEPMLRGAQLGEHPRDAVARVGGELVR